MHPQYTYTSTITNYTVTINKFKISISIINKIIIHPEPIIRKELLNRIKCSSHITVKSGTFHKAATLNLKCNLTLSIRVRSTYSRNPELRVTPF